MSGKSPKCKANPTDWFYGLTEFERRFVEEYIVDLNGRKALERCGKEYASNASARVTAYQVRQRPGVRAAIEKLFDARGAGKVRIIEEYAKIAFANLGDFVRIEKDAKGRPYVRVIPHDELDKEDQIAALSEISEVKNDDGSISIKVKTCDKLAALTYLAKASRLFVDRQEISGPNGGPLTVEAADARDRLKDMLGLNKKPE